MPERSIEDRLDSLEAEAANASIIPSQIDCAREAIELMRDILVDLIADRPDAADFEDDLDRIDQLRALML